MFVERSGDRVSVKINALGDIAATLRVTAEDRVVAEIPISFSALRPVTHEFGIPDGVPFRVDLPELGLDYSSDPTVRELTRPFEMDPAARESMQDVDVRVFEARELLKGRRYKAAREIFESALNEEPWNREALMGLADLSYRRGLYEQGLVHVNRALQLDAYDAAANFLAGNLYRALDRGTDAREAFGWAVRSMEYRSVGYVQLAELSLAKNDLVEAARYARFALDYDRVSIPARRVLALVGRKSGNALLAAQMMDSILEIDPLNHFARVERLHPKQGSSASKILTFMQSEYPDQALLELAIDYVRLGATEDALSILEIGQDAFPNPLFRFWQAWLMQDPSLLPSSTDLGFVFPYRQETCRVLEWAVEYDSNWSTSFLVAMNLWALDREDDAAARLESLVDRPDYAPFYVTRAILLDQLRGRDQEADLRRAVQMDGSNRTIRIHLIRYLQSADRWEEALTESATARELFPDDFNLDLLHVQSLNNLGRPLEAIDILTSTHVLPSENARESHHLYEQAHTMAALDEMDADDFEEARTHLRAALEWPESLGQGRPYEPEERFVRFLLGRVESNLDNYESAREEFESVAAATDRRDIKSDRLDLLVIPTLVALERSASLSEVVFDQDTEVGRFAGDLIRTIERGGDVDATLMGLAVAHVALFDDVVGSILLRALTSADYRGGSR
jgi:tetratricopeptide (TPR) repeat protein